MHLRVMETLSQRVDLQMQVVPERIRAVVADVPALLRFVENRTRRFGHLMRNRGQSSKPAEYVGADDSNGCTLANALALLSQKFTSCHISSLSGLFTLLLAHHARLRVPRRRAC